MGFNTLLTGGLILLGTGVMVLSVSRTLKILQLVKTSQYRRSWRTLFVLMVFFAVGYMMTLILVSIGITDLLIALTGVIFFFGALFVYIVVRIGFLTISELLATQHSLTTARDEAIKASQLKTELLGRVSHELRTPLHAILGYSDMLETAVYGPLKTKQQETVKRISVNAERLDSHISYFLQQVQIEAGELSIRQHPMAPANLLKHIDMIVDPLTAKKNLRLGCEIDAAVPPIIMGDEHLLQGIITNLVGNAVKFTSDGFVDVRIFLPKPNSWAIEVKDSGPGISAEAMKIIFEPFRQADGTITRRFGGTGLGLAIVKQITELMEGNVSVESEVGKGSCFTITLPLIRLPSEVST